MADNFAESRVRAAKGAKFYQNLVDARVNGVILSHLPNARCAKIRHTKASGEGYLAATLMHGIQP